MRLAVSVCLKSLPAVPLYLTDIRGVNLYSSPGRKKLFFVAILRPDVVKFTRKSQNPDKSLRISLHIGN